MLELINITKKYQIRKDKMQTVLKDVNIKFSNTGFVSILGSSGNGKTTLLNLVGGLDKIDSGKILFNQEEVIDFEKFRRERVGYVFQQLNLIEHLNAVDNVIVSMGDHIENKKDIATKILKDMGLEESLHKLPKHLSGGQRQRIAIARMIAKDVDIIICDEPTGSLDEETGKSIVDIIKELSKDKLVLFVTHNRKIAEEYSDRIVTVNRGKLVENDGNPKDIGLNEQHNSRSYNKNIAWLSIKSLIGRFKYTIKYLLLTTFILLVASMAFILEGEFFKQYMHEESVDTGIKSIIVDVNSEGADELIQNIKSTEHVQHVTPNYNLTIGLAASNYESTRASSETKVENITGNDYIKSIITNGRFPEKSDEILMTAEGVITLLKELKIGGERLYDQYMTGEMTSDLVFDLVDWKQFIVAEYGMPRIKIVGLIDDDRIYEEYHKVYFINGLFDLFEYPGGVKTDQIKIYKDNLYLEANNEIVNEITQTENIIVNEDYSTMVHGIYSHIDSLLQLSKMTLYMVLVIATVSFLSLQYTSLFERKYEIGLYRALGYSKKSILKTLASEMFIISTLSLFIVLIVLSLFSLLVYLKLDYYNSYIDILDTLNIMGIIGSLFVIISLFTIIIVYTGNFLILKKSVLSNINDL
ncbi:MAG: ABC transporter ATP-binding protein/permease [Clostridiales bacterium]|nr:ABC transporter ATP-binding protein/permease [Clostridiales bacterium]